VSYQCQQTVSCQCQQTVSCQCNNFPPNIKMKFLKINSINAYMHAITYRLRQTAPQQTTVRQMMSVRTTITTMIIAANKHLMSRTIIITSKSELNCVTANHFNYFTINLYIVYIFRTLNKLFFVIQNILSLKQH